MAGANIASAIALFTVLHLGICFAADESHSPSDNAEPLTNKLTISEYHNSSGIDAMDLNLRHNFTSSTAWIGTYKERDGFGQARVGWEYDWRTDGITLVPSLQAATHSFAGGSIYSEIGHDIFGIAGYSRTNLRPYWNLNFDPNDSVQYGLGVRNRSGSTISLFTIRDNRLHTGQSDVHLYIRHYLSETRRLTIDFVHKHGNDDDGSTVKAFAMTMGFDWRRWFVRAAIDPYVNFSAEHQSRLSAGLRF